MKLRPAFIITLGILFSFLSANGQNSDIELLKKHVYRLASDDLKGRGFGSPDGARAAEYIRSQFIEAGVEPLLEDYYHEFIHRQGILNITGRNVVGVVRGSDPVLKDEYIVIGAHYDHLGWEFEDGDTVVYNGADDNASGTSAVIELGRLLAANPSGLKRSVVLVAFDGEESGLIGSGRFVKDEVIPLSAIKAMFSLDMIGMYSSNNGIELGGIKLVESYEALVNKAVESSSVEIVKMDAHIENRTDTSPFGNVGIPSIYIATGISHSPYHKPEDDSDLLDYEGMVTITNFMSELVTTMSAFEELNPSGTMETISKSSGMKRINAGVKAYSGNTYFNYPDAFYQSKNIYAAGGGLFLEARISQWLAIQPEVIYSTNGGQQDLGNLRAHSVSTPVSLLFTSPDPSNNGVRGYFQVGGYYSYSFAGKIGNSAMDFNTIYNNQQYGLILGGGMEIMNMRIGYMATHSFVDYLQTPGPDGNLRMKGSYFTIGWVF